MLKQDNFFTSNECDLIIAGIEQYADKYTTSYNRIQTLGQSYFGSLANTNYNPMLAVTYYKEHQRLYDGPWYEILARHMSELFPDCEIKYSNKWSRPGFNKVDKENPEPTLWHYDSEKTVFPYEEEFPEFDGDLEGYFDGVYTFTIMLVDGDFTFDYFPQSFSKWSTRRNAVNEMTNIPCSGHFHLEGDDCKNPECTLTEYETQHYKKGTLLMQDRRVLHRKGWSKYKDQSRISMQGHAVRKDNVVFLHW